jgi:hypothetical protein
MEVIDNIVSPDDRRRKYSDKQILKILVLLQIFSISYRSSRIFLTNHEEYLRTIGLKEIPSFQTLSRRARMIDLHAINRKITFLHSMESIAAVDSLLVMDWLTTKGNIHDSRVSRDMIDSVRNFSHILADSAYDTSDTYDYVFENTHALPVIDTNKRRGIVPERLSVNRKIGIDLRKEYASLYSLRWEIERTFSILEEIMRAENIWYNRNRSYDTAMGLKAIAYNLMVISNIEAGEKPREIMKIVSC